MLSQNQFIHHVYFWLENPTSTSDHGALLAGLNKLSAVSSILEFHIGVPASTNRGVIDASYHFSLLTIFASQADQDAYQIDPMHLAFVDTCKHLWEKVIVYDSIGAE